jgi:hypothetical protein
MRSRRQREPSLLPYQVSQNTPDRLRHGHSALTSRFFSLPSAVCTGTAPESFVPPGAAATTAASYVPNVFFSFPYVATYFANPGHCSAAISQCNANHAACTSQLAEQDGAGGGYAVTVVVPGGGGTTVTAGGGISVGAAAATSICKSRFMLCIFCLWFSLSHSLSHTPRAIY